MIVVPNARIDRSRRRSAMTDPATIYETWFVPALFAPLAREVLARTDVPEDARVLDVACGSGIVARTIASRVGPEGSVIGLDANPAMLGAARRAAAVEGVTIEWRQGNAQDLPFANGSFDLVICQMGLQFFPDRARVAAEMARVLAPGGQVIVSTWRGLDQNPFFATYERAVRHRFQAPALMTPFALGDPAVVATLLLKTGLQDVSVKPVTVEANYTAPDHFIEFQLLASSAAIPELQTLDAPARQALIEAIRDELAQPVREATIGDRIRFPMQGIVARGVKAL
jgi:SAM-dependent methyltransferase